ncbi:MAG: hypothetical protein ACT4QF_24015 [Sporichthyaceae bacterium]
MTGIHVTKRSQVTGRAGMTVSRVGRTGRAGTRHARRLALVLGAPALGAILVATALPAAAVGPTFADAICDPTPGDCATSAVGGSTDTFAVRAVGGTRKATLVAAINRGAGPVCPGAPASTNDFATVGFTNLRDGASWTKFVKITGLQAATPGAAVRAARTSLVCFEAPYRFFVRPGFKPGTGPAEKGPYSGVLATCAEVDSIFPTEIRGRVQPLPCVQRTRAVEVSGGFAVHNEVRIPRDAAFTRLRQTY